MTGSAVIVDETLYVLNQWMEAMGLRSLPLS